MRIVPGGSLAGSMASLGGHFSIDDILRNSYLLMVSCADRNKSFMVDSAPAIYIAVIFSCATIEISRPSPVTKGE